MPEFILNDKNTREFTDLPKITQGYIEAMFFTECDGSLIDGTFDPENNGVLPCEASWLDIQQYELTRLVTETVAWRDANAVNLALAYEAGKDHEYPYDETRAGHDLWYTSKGHGVGFWDRGFPKELGDALSDAARDFHEYYPGWETFDKEEGTGVVYIN